MKAFGKNADVKHFEQVFLPHLNAAHNLARWLLRDGVAAQDVVQESCLRAFASQHQFIGGNARAWLLKIVRNQCYTWLQESSGKCMIDIDNEATMSELDKATLSHSDLPEKLVTKIQDAQRLQQALDELPPVFKEAIVLKELEEFSYKEIASITGVPIGTVMSRLARGREMLKKELLSNDE